MNKLFSTLLFLATGYIGYSWRPVAATSTIAADYEALVAAERAFADFTGKHGIKAGFSKFLGDDALVVEKGRYALGKPIYEKAPEQRQRALLSWWPVHADIAASGDLGFTTGPFEVRPRAATDAPVAFGQFTSIWRKTSTGEWKVLADVGVAHPAPTQTPSPHLVPPATTTTQVGPADTLKWRQELLATEKGMENVAATKSLQAAYNRVLASAQPVRLYWAGRAPAVGEAAWAFAATQTQRVTYSAARAVVATSGDLGFTYGYGQSHQQKGPFLRIWKRDDSHSWRLVHEVFDLH